MLDLVVSHIAQIIPAILQQHCNVPAIATLL